VYSILGAETLHFKENFRPLGQDAHHSKDFGRTSRSVGFGVFRGGYHSRVVPKPVGAWRHGYVLPFCGTDYWSLVCESGWWAKVGQIGYGAHAP
jgi:hypothetical protein